MTAILFLPGMMCDARLFGPQFDALSGRYTIQAAPIGADETIGEIAAGVLAEAPPRFCLAGLSMGGIVAMEILRQAPERVVRLALMDTNPLAESAEMKAKRGPQIEAARSGRLRAVMREEMKPNYLFNGPDKQRILDLCMDMATDLGPGVFVRQSLALRERRDYGETLKQVTCPTLILCGRHDALCPVERHELMVDLIPGARLEIIEDAGHLPTLEQPEETNTALIRWLEA